MVKLPGGFSPVNAVKQFGSIVNPTGGVTDYDVFSDFSVGGSVNGPSANVVNQDQLPSFTIDQSRGYTTPAGGLDSGSVGGANDFRTPQASGSGGGGADPQSLQNQQIINAQADVTRSKLSNLLRTLSPQENAARAKTLDQFQTASNDLLRSKATGERNLNYAQDQVQGEKVRNLKTLGDQIRQMNFSYANQLGAFGAGDSSAANMISQAVAQLGANNRGNILSGASDQLTQIGFQREDLEQAFSSNIAKLDKWKQGTLADIATEFANKKNAIQEAMQTADVSRYQELAKLDATFTAQALDKLKGLESTYTSQANNLIKQFQNILAPQDARIDPRLGEFVTKPVSPGELAGVRMPQQVNPEDNLSAIIRKRDEQDLTL